MPDDRPDHSLKSVDGERGADEPTLRLVRHFQVKEADYMKPPLQEELLEPDGEIAPDPTMLVEHPGVACTCNVVCTCVPVSVCSCNTVCTCNTVSLQHNVTVAVELPPRHEEETTVADAGGDAPVTQTPSSEGSIEKALGPPRTTVRSKTTQPGGTGLFGGGSVGTTTRAPRPGRTTTTRTWGGGGGGYGGYYAPCF